MGHLNADVRKFLDENKLMTSESKIPEDSKALVVWLTS